MKTKVTILGEQPTKTEPKKIEFVKSITSNGFSLNIKEPHYYNFIELICRRYVSGLDLMYAFTDVNRDGVAYLGHFNDGVV